MGNKGSSPQVQQTTQTQNASVAPDPYVLQQIYSTLGKAQKAASTPFKAYTGELTAGLTPTQQQAISGLGGIQQQFTQAGQPISAEDIQRYQDPYRQQVIDATQAAFNRQNAVGLNQLRGGLAAKNAFGNSRAGIAEGSYLAGQAAQQNPVIANLYSQGYQGALSAAQADRQAQLAAATSGIAGQQALLGAGTLEQQTQQAANTAQYEQYLRAQGYPFETAQYLASILGGIGGLAGTRSEGTSTGETKTTPPQPSMLGQIAGLGAAALSFMPGGQPFAMGLGALGALSKAAGGSAGGDEASLYRRSYVPTAQLGRGPGLQPAQAPQLHMGDGEVKSNEPSIQDWAKLGKGLGEINWSGVSGSLSNAGQALSSFSLPSFMTGGLASGGRVAPSLAPGTVADSFDDRFGEWPDSFDDRFNALATPGVGVRSGGDDGFDAFYLRDLPVHRSPPEYFLSPTPVRYAADGGVMGDDDEDLPGFDITQGAETGLRGPRATRNISPDTWGSKSYGSLGLNSKTGSLRQFLKENPGLALPSPDSADFDSAWRGLEPSALQRAERGYYRNHILGPVLKGLRGNNVPSIVADDPRVHAYLADRRDQMGEVGWGSAMQILQSARSPEEAIAALSTHDRRQVGSYFRSYLAEHPTHTRGLLNRISKREAGVLGDAPVVARGGDDDDDELPANSEPVEGVAPRGLTSSADANSGLFSSPGIFGISPRGREALLAAGLGMLASRNPNALGAIGEGGLKGLAHYQEGQKEDLARELQRQRLEQANQRISETAYWHDKLADMREKLAGQKGNKIDIIPGVSAENNAPVGRDANGNLINIVTKEPITPDTPLTRGTQVTIDDDTAENIADQWLAGDQSAMAGLGRSPVTIAKIRGIITRKMKEMGRSAQEQTVRVGEFKAMLKAQQTVGARAGQVELAAEEANQLIPVAEEAAAKVPRTQWIPLNKAIQAFKLNTGDPNVRALGSSIVSLSNAYLRAISPTGVPTDRQRAALDEILSSTDSPEQFAASIAIMRKEIEAAKKAPKEVIKHFRDTYGGKEESTPATPTPTPSLRPPSDAERAEVDAQVKKLGGNKTELEHLRSFITKKGLKPWF